MIKLTDSQKDVIKQAIETFDHDKQIAKAIEELSELITALARKESFRATKEEIIDEICDAFIMVNQLAMIYGVQAVEKRLVKKIAKLNGYLETYQGLIQAVKANDSHDKAIRKYRIEDVLKDLKSNYCPNYILDEVEELLKEND